MTIASRSDATARTRKRPMVKLVGISKSFGAFEALRRIDLSVPEGSFFSLLGPSGSGKTTLLNLIAGTLRPTAGRIFIDGRDATDTPPAARGLGMVFQHYALMPHMSVFENVAFPLQVRGVAKADIRRRVHEALELVRLPHLADRKPRALSGGQQQRISLARCIVYRPSLILMDEPLGALDKKLRKEMQIEISRLHRELGITMLYVTHDQEEALTMSDRIVLMNQGRIEQVGTAEELYFRPESAYAADFIGDSNLLPASVMAVGDTLELQAFGNVLTAPLPDLAVSTGERVRLLVRPESAYLAAAVEQGVNRLQGRLTESMVSGAMVKHFVALNDESLFEVAEVNRAGRWRPALGDEVTIAWRPEDTRALPHREAAQ